MKRILTIALFMASLSHAAIINYTFSGTFSASTPVSSLTAPDTPFTLTFEVPETPVPSDFVTGTRFNFFSPVTLTFGANILTFPSADFSFYDADSGGGFSVLLTSGGDEANFSTFSEQLYTGSEEFPVMRTGVFNVPVHPFSRVGVVLASGLGDDSHDFTVDGTISGTTGVPEPGTTGAVASGIVALLFFARLRKA